MNCFFINNLLDILHGVCIGGEKLFLIQGDSPQFLNWEEYGLKITVSQGTISPTETNEIAVTALVGGQFQLPEGTELISAVYAISVSKPLLQSVKLEIQHCADIVTQDHTSYLSFATASVNQSVLPYEFELEEGGQFLPGEQYGSIYLSEFSLKGVVKSSTKPISCLPDSSEETDSNVDSTNVTGDSDSEEVASPHGSSSDDEMTSSTSEPPIESNIEVHVISSVEGKYICEFVTPFVIVIDNSVTQFDHQEITDEVVSSTIDDKMIVVERSLDMTEHTLTKLPICSSNIQNKTTIGNLIKICYFKLLILFYR